MNFSLNTASAVLETERLILRSLTEQDAAALLKLRSDEKVNTWLNRPSNITAHDVDFFIDKLCENLEINGGEYWAVTFKNSDELIGTICFWNMDPAINQAEVGYELKSEYHGQGIMPEALDAVVAFGFEVMNLQTIVAWPRVENIPSVKLLERAGFKPFGLESDGFVAFQRKK